GRSISRLISTRCSPTSSVRALRRTRSWSTPASTSVPLGTRSPPRWRDCSASSPADLAAVVGSCRSPTYATCCTALCCILTCSHGARACDLGVVAGEVGYRLRTGPPVRQVDRILLRSEERRVGKEWRCGWSERQFVC